MRTIKQEIDISKGRLGHDPYDKQETLEEAIDNEIKNIHINSSNLENIATYNRISGTLLSELKKCMTNIAKWQEERSYSEEEVSDLLKCLRIELNINKELIDIDEWFEQFKNK